MDLAQLLRLVATSSILLLVFALGTRATFRDVTSLIRDVFRPPHWLARALTAMYIVVPAAAVCIGLALDLPRPVRVGLLAIAIAPIPPILPGRQLRSGGSPGRVFGLLVAASLIAMVQVPIMVAILGRVFGRETSFGPGDVAAVIGVTILVPLTGGLVLRRLSPRLSDAIAPSAIRLGTALLAVAMLIIFIKVGPAMLSLSRGNSMFAFVSMAAIAIAAGHWIGGPDVSDRATLAFASAMRHPGLALAVATANLPEEPGTLAAILLYVLVAFAMTGVYAATVRRQRLQPRPLS